ncbi:MAG: carboxypeptidase regulatory-like domain-containing protein [Gemmataceae bacterium]|nr:carboxypeptidase regulatory-like domain-containing protein [Gemmataceae bacterium]
MIPRCQMVSVGVLLLLVVLPGCGKKDGRVPVVGTVTYRGNPVPNALVVFMPETPDLLPSSGLTDDNGRYELMTIVRGDGASPGMYRVTITARGSEKVRPGAVFDPTGSNAEPGAALVPTKYFMPDTAGLKADVQPGGITADFKLVDE